MTLHADALSGLRRWSAPTPEQEVVRRRYVAHLEARPDAMTRECRPDHLTASTLVLSADHTQVLLTLHAKARRWFQLGGHCEPGDTTLAGAAHREASEESGLIGLVLDPVPVQLSEHAVPFCGAGLPDGPVHHLDVRFVTVAAPDARHEVSEESLAVAWWSVDALPDADRDLVDLVSLALARARVGPDHREPDQSTPGGGSVRVAADQPSR